MAASPDTRFSLGMRVGLSVLGTGYIPQGGGTIASLVALVLAWFLPFGPWLLSGITAGILIFGVWGSARAEQGGWAHDDSRITVDEFAGMLAALILIPRSLIAFGAAFLLFRILDILKPPPLRFLERLPKGWGVMLDDLAAGIAANLLIQLTRLLPPEVLYGI